jgi:segregation and condensation protein A
MAVASLDLDLEVFQGPFDLLLTLVLKEEVDLLEVDLAEVVLAYVEHLESAGELDLEAATEFLVLIAALLELKSRLILPREEDEEIDLDRAEAADELLARMLEYTRYRRGAAFLRERIEAESGFRYRSAPLPKELRRWPRPSAACCGSPSRSRWTTWPSRWCRWKRASRTCARCCPDAGASPSTRRWRERTA